MGDGQLHATRTFQWPHPISEVVNALLGAGLELLALDEGWRLPWRFSERMVPVGDGEWAWPPQERAT